MIDLDPKPTAEELRLSEYARDALANAKSSGRLDRLVQATLAAAVPVSPAPVSREPNALAGKTWSAGIGAGAIAAAVAFTWLATHEEVPEPLPASAPVVVAPSAAPDQPPPAPKHPRLRRGLPSRACRTSRRRSRLLLRRRRLLPRRRRRSRTRPTSARTLRRWCRSSANIPRSSSSAPTRRVAPATMQRQRRSIAASSALTPAAVRRSPLGSSSGEWSSREAPRRRRSHPSTRTSPASIEARSTRRRSSAGLGACKPSAGARRSARHGVRCSNSSPRRQVGAWRSSAQPIDVLATALASFAIRSRSPSRPARTVNASSMARWRAPRGSSC